MAQVVGGGGEAFVEQLARLAPVGFIGAQFGGLLAVLGGFVDDRPPLVNSLDSENHGKQRLQS
ncbi:hypothetical protein [Streptosporangium sp. NPDC023615]|uniref:hypothetical protein n=1 Tax=Streptosporangium sp. NPDC023615 TaxID=3154794 RepID=UPI00342E2332